MKNRNTYYSTSKQRFSWALVLFFCLFVSSIEYFPAKVKQSRTEQSAEQPAHSFLDVAVDAVVPFALEVANTVFYLISQLFQVDFLAHLPKVEAASFVNSFTEILLERIISPQGP
jgi:spore maturation protein SpmA